VAHSGQSKQRVHMACLCEIASLRYLRLLVPSLMFLSRAALPSFDRHNRRCSRFATAP